MFENKVRTCLETVLGYESDEAKAKGLEVIPLERFEKEAKDSVEIAVEFGEDNVPAYEDCLLENLLYWFKREFFTWMDRPPCWNCTNASTEFIGVSQPSNHDKKHGASRTENYRCLKCPAGIMFPRYNDPLKLIETRKGRCGEWANTFTFLCRCLDLNVRYVVDWTDHVWTEYYSKSKNRWIHVDCCECIMDKPLLYEKGWGKKLTYVVGIGRYGVTDVTRRYTQQWAELLKRRNEISETALETILANITMECRISLPQSLQEKLKVQDEAEKQELLQEQRLNVVEELPGRTTGSAAWRQSRGETGDTSNGKIPLRPAGVRYKRLNFSEHAGGDYLHDGIVRGSGDNPPAETIEKLFDGKVNSKWLDFGGGGEQGSAWIEYSLSKTTPAIQLASYIVVAAGDSEERDPSSWKLEGLPDAQNGDWIQLDEQKEVVFPNRGASLSFEVQTTVKCRRFRVCFWGTRDRHRSNSIQLAELRLVAKAAHEETKVGQTKDFATRMRQLFDQFVQDGMSPNDAAVKALRQLKDQT